MPDRIPRAGAAQRRVAIRVFAVPAGHSRMAKRRFCTYPAIGQRGDRCAMIALPGVDSSRKRAPMATSAAVFDNNMERWLSEQDLPWQRLKYRLVQRNLARHLG